MAKIKVAVIGAGGKMGTRTSNNLAKHPEEIELFFCENSTNGIQGIIGLIREKTGFGQSFAA